MARAESTLSFVWANEDSAKLGEGRGYGMETREGVVIVFFRPSIDFPGRCVRGQKFFIASMPGMYQDEWKEHIQVEVEERVKRDQLVSTSCVFFPSKC